jgi:hypothetical protein
MLTAALVATALLAPHAISQSVDVSNTQTQNGALTSGQTLDVVENYGLLNVTADTAGNLYSGGTESVDAVVTSTQNNFGALDASITVTGTNTGAPELSLGTPTYIQATATVNSLTWNGKNAAYTAIDAQQDNQGASVYAGAQINAPNNSLYESVEVNTIAVANHQAYEVANGRLDIHAGQTSSGEVRAATGAVVVYSPSPNLYTATAINNDLTSYSADRGSQEAVIAQQVQGPTESYVSLNGGNVWDAAIVSSATANNINIANAGGSLVASASQVQDGEVKATAVQTQYEYSTATTQADAIGNSAAFNNSDIYVRLDLEQISNGGVSSEADTTLYNGYDAYIDASAIGNQIVGSACAQCGADLGATSNQVNNSHVSSVANTSVTGSNRSIVATARAVGNSATYYATGGH